MAADATIATERAAVSRARLDIGFRLALAAFWVAALPLPAAWSFDDDGLWNHYVGPMYGLELLAFGWVGLLEGQFGWVANLLFFPVLFLPGKHPSRRRLIVSAVLGLLIGSCLISAILWESMWGMEDEIIRPYGAGYWLWIAAIAGATGRLALLVLLGRRRAAGAGAMTKEE